MDERNTRALEKFGEYNGVERLIIQRVVAGYIIFRQAKHGGRSVLCTGIQLDELMEYLCRTTLPFVFEW